MEDIPSFIPIKISFDIPRSQGIETINYPTLVIFNFLASYFLPELRFFFSDFFLLFV